jgi:hypothetical protein
MAYISDYRTGTVALTTGTKDLVGTGTAWTTIGLQTGDLFMRDGFVGLIETVVDNTHITLRDNWGGPSLPAGSTYTIKFSPDQSRVQASTVALIERLGAAIFTELAALDISTADRLLYTDAANSLGLAPLTAFARGLLDDGDASTALSTLGFSDFFKSLVDDVNGTTLQTSIGYTATDVLAKLLSVNGAASSYTPPNADEFAGYPTGVSYSSVLGVSGFPANVATVLTVKSGSNRTFQIGVSNNGMIAAIRAQHVSNAGVNGWSSWVNIPTNMDYEEGTWTPGVSFGGASTGVAYASRGGTYTKIGRLVVAPFNVNLANKGSSTGNATLTGLPFTTAAGVFNNGIVGYFGTLSGITEGNVLLTIESGGAFFRMGGSISTGTLTDGNFTNASVLRGTAIFHT